MSKILELGVIANTHGIIGELKIDCRCDTPDFVRQFDKLSIGGVEYAVERCRTHKHFAIVKLRGVDTVQDAQALKGKSVSADVSGVILPEGRHFIADLIGLPVIEGGKTIGTLADVLTMPAHDVYVLSDGRMIPNVPAFVKRIDNGIYVELIEGL